MSFFRDVSFGGAGSDIWAYLREKRDYNWLFWIVACIPPAAILVTFELDSAKRSIPPPPTPMYFESWPATRSVEETRAAQAKLQARKDEFERKKRESYKALGRATGIDVDRIEREALAEKAAKEKAEAAQKAAAAQQKPQTTQSNAGAAP